MLRALRACVLLPGLQLNFKLLMDLHEVADKHNDAQV